MTDAAQKAALVEACGGNTLQLSDRGACDVELLIVGCAPSPLHPTAPPPIMMTMRA